MGRRVGSSGAPVSCSVSEAVGGRPAGGVEQAPGSCELVPAAAEGAAGLRKGCSRRTAKEPGCL